MDTLYIRDFIIFLLESQLGSEQTQGNAVMDKIENKLIGKSGNPDLKMFIYDDNIMIWGQSEKKKTREMENNCRRMRLKINTEKTVVMKNLGNRMKIEISEYKE